MLLHALIGVIISVAFASKSSKAGYRIRDSVTRHCLPGIATFLVDGINPRRGEKLLKTLPTDIRVSFALSKDELEIRRVRQLARYAIAQGHTLVYRFRPEYDRRFHHVSPRRIVKELSVMKRIFTDRLGYNLQYVHFPLAKHHLTQLTEAVEVAGFTVFGPSSYAHGKLYRDLRAMTKKNVGAVVHFNGHDTRLADKMESVFLMARKAKMQLESIDQCLARESTA